MMIVTKETELRIPSEKITKKSEGLRIVRKLFRELDKNKTGVGLSAPQIGIYKRVFVMDVGQKIAMINPIMIYASSDMMTGEEGCLSFPGIIVKTYRHLFVEFETDNHRLPLNFYGNKGCICSQHEYDHLDGILFFDRTI